MFGAGIYTSQVFAEELQALGTRSAIGVRFVRDYSPAYYADILPGDVILKVNGKPAEPSIWKSEILDDQPDSLDIVRGGKAVTLLLAIPPEWRTLPNQSGEGK
jgi:S1-C subfamily serine protease